MCKLIQGIINVPFDVINFLWFNNDTRTVPEDMGEDANAIAAEYYKSVRVKIKANEIRVTILITVCLWLSLGK